MTRSLVVAALVSLFVLPSLAPAQESPGDTTGTVPGSADAKKPVSFLVPRARIVQMTGTASQILAVEPVQARVKGSVTDPQEMQTARKFFEALDAKSSFSEPVLRPGERVCLRIDPPGIVAAKQDFDRDHPCALTLYTFEGFDGNRDVVSLTKAEQLTYDVPEGALRDLLKAISVGSTVVLAGTTNGDHSTLSQVEVPRIEIDPAARFWAMAVAIGALFIFSSLALGTSPFGIFVGADNRYSSSKFQAALWFFVLITTYLATVFFRWTHAGLVGGVTIPTNLFLISGLSVLTFAGAKAMKQNQMGNAEAEFQKATRDANLAMDAASTSEKDIQPLQCFRRLYAPEIRLNAMTQRAAMEAQTVAEEKNKALSKMKDAGTPRFWYDLTHDDNDTPSLSKFQLMVVILIAVGIYLFQAWEFLATVPVQAKISLPDVDTALLTAFGLGQGAYLGVKFAADAK
jgi:hypothetical protein